MNTGGGFFGDAFDAGSDAMPQLWFIGDGTTKYIEDDRPLFGVFLGGIRNDASTFVFNTLMDEQGCVATIVEDHVWTATVGPAENLLSAPPVLLECFTLPRENRNASRTFKRSVWTDDDCSSSVVLS